MSAECAIYCPNPSACNNKLTDLHGDLGIQQSQLQELEDGRDEALRSLSVANAKQVTAGAFIEVSFSADLDTAVTTFGNFDHEVLEQHESEDELVTLDEQLCDAHYNIAGSVNRLSVTRERIANATVLRSAIDRLIPRCPGPRLSAEGRMLLARKVMQQALKTGVISDSYVLYNQIRRRHSRCGSPEVEALGEELKSI